VVRQRALFVATAGLAGALGCGVALVGTGPDDVDAVEGTTPWGGDGGADGASGVDGADGGPADTPPDAPDATFDVVDAEADGGCPAGSFRCGTPPTCITNCLACKGTAFECEVTRACTLGCASCTGAAFECTTCSAGDLVVTGQRCAPNDTTCYSGTKRCAGCKSVSCPGREQMCVHVTGTDYECYGCGETNTNGYTCAGGGTCNAATFTCP
jgi:hypothetical protein